MRSALQTGFGIAALAALVAGTAVTGTALTATTPVRSGVRPMAASQTQAVSITDPHRALVTTYCLSCHTQQQKARGAVPVALDALNFSNPAADARVWESVVRKMRAGVMPPPGMPRPERVTSDGFLGWAEGELDRAARLTPNPGRTEPFHRLNRAEYRNAVRDLLHLDIDVSALLPADDASYGFDNIAGVLKLSPTLMERYLSAAQKTSRLALGTPPPTPTYDYFRVADDLAQDDRLPGQIFGTRGGAAIRYTFPMDAQYAIRVQLSRDLNEQVPIYTDAQQLEVSIDGARVQLFTLPAVGRPAPPPATEPGSDSPDDSDEQPTQPALARGGGGRGQAPAPAAGRGQVAGTAGATATGRGQAPTAARGGGGGNARQGQEARNRADRDWEVRVPVTAGPHELQVSFIKRTSALAETARLPFVRPYPAGVNIAETRTGAYLRSVEISGPFDPTGPGASPSRQHIFVCRPTAVVEETACAKKILGSLARRAYRRPVADADLRPLLAFYNEGRRDGGFDAGIERALDRLLVSPEFLFRIETDPPKVTAGAAYRVSNLELASRLSFFLWSSIPDEELLNLAERGRLREPATLDRQVRRMIADARFDSFVERFAGQWLFLQNLAAAVPVQSSFPDFDDTLRQAFRRETELFLDSIIREDKSALDLLRADYTFVNERLARHYGIPNVKGNRFRRVSLSGEGHRGGILGHGSILTVTSYPDRTSPVVRGKWILENLLGTPPPAPPPNVPELKPASFAGPVLSMRERIAQHRRSAVCASCHSMMDPLGLALENFDGVGKWRALDDSGAPVDASGSMPDGTKFTGREGLAQALLGSDRFVMTLTEKLLTYALGRGLEPYDAPAVRAIVRGAGRQDHRLTALIRGVVESVPFQMRTAPS